MAGKWVTDRVPTPDEREEAGDTGFIVCVSGCMGNWTYDHAICMGDCFYEPETGGWAVNGLLVDSTITIHGWMMPPEWEEED